MKQNRIALALLVAAVFLMSGFFVLWVAQPSVEPPRRFTDSALGAEIVAPEQIPGVFNGDRFDDQPIDMAAALEPEPLGPAEYRPEPDESFIAFNESTAVSEPAPTDAFLDVPDETPDDSPASDQPVLWADGAASKSLRNPDFPDTYISRVDVDLTSPNHWVRLTWTGPKAARQETGPFHSSPGAGLGNNDCNDIAESNRDGSNCTPKGDFAVEAFSDHMRTYTHCRFVTWFDIPRAIAFHSYWDVPDYPASHGCVRLDTRAAQLIHNNSLMGKTKVTVDGTWTR